MENAYTILHGFGEVEGSTKLAPGVFVGGSKELMNEVRMDCFDPNDTLFIKGHQAWEHNQLSQELQNGEWYPVSVSSAFILRHALGEANYDGDLWYDIMTCIGGEYSQVADEHADNKGMMP